ncbi:DeoR/GlpR family DNA-binding transcription regulator [Hyphomicrobium sp.]|uniref:DeoR/GlpR family DNA-binding transcription regulator n=1 Tax=Hyphomicrobium sp. TaxID=82 RepID=UPI002D786310|nr:DeoR/GlpR family DNA-binding transcription regulator [Hyphomicrobium sp.]HET6389591.1 DeoR/GlpR family DNA-binding transcription regulator [Hyphomicrobium sp.]
MRPSLRRERIEQLVREQQRVTVDGLAELLGASKETIRRDLTDLAERGRVRKFHGGATIAEPRQSEPDIEGSFQARLQENARAKRAIAKRAIQLFKPGDTLFVDTGTTTLFFAEEMARATGLTVITNSGVIAALAALGTANQVFLIGGEYRADRNENLGPLAIEQIGRFHSAHAVLTVGSVETVGILDYDLGEANIARAMIAQSRSVTVLADSSKFGRGGLIKVAGLNAIERIVTEKEPPEDIADAMKAASVPVIVAA